jgi:uncharacterized protein (DUF1697 family)
MTRYIALLRAINVGGHVVKMDELRRQFESLGLKNVETFIQSGNVIFESAAKSSAALEHKIEQQLKKAFGFEVITFVRSVPELTEVARSKAFSDLRLESGSVLYVAFLREPLSAQVRARLKALEGEVDGFHFGNREIFWLRQPQPGSPASALPIEKIIGSTSTVRNSSTVKRLVAKYCGV